MKLAAMQPYFFPYVGYFQLIAAVDTFIVYDRVAYIRHGWVNRNRLLRVNAEPFYIIVPLLHHSPTTPIAEVWIDNRQPWRISIGKQIEMNYRKSPFFEDVYRLVQQALCGSEEKLTDLNANILRWVCEFLEIATPLMWMPATFEQIEREVSAARRAGHAVFPGLPDDKTQRVFQICRHFQADEYINAIGGQALYGREIFAAHGIDLKFIRTRPYAYRQRARQFFAHLSILDVLMNCGKAGTQQLLQAYDLI